MRIDDTRAEPVFSLVELFQEIVRLNSYSRRGYQLSFLRTENGVEIDLVLQRGNRELLLVEIESTNDVTNDHLKALHNVGSKLGSQARYGLSQDPVSRVVDGTQVLPWQEGVRRIFS